MVKSDNVVKRKDDEDDDEDAWQHRRYSRDVGYKGMKVAINDEVINYRGR